MSVAAAFESAIRPDRCAPPHGEGRAEPPGPTIAWREPPGEAGLAPGRAALCEAALTLLTLGLYRCVVRTRLRRHMWASLHIGGRPLAYTGSVRDLLVPALAVLGGLAAVVLLVVIAKMLAVPRPRLSPSPWRFLITIPLVYLLGLAAWRHRAFLLSRTRLDSVCGSLTGNRHAFAARHLATALGAGLTLGWIIPWRQVMLQRRLIDGMRLGGHRFTLEGSARVLLGRFALAWAGVVTVYLTAVLAVAFTLGPKIAAARRAGTWPSLEVPEIVLAAAIGLSAAAAIGLIAAWYRIGAWRHLAAMTRLDGAPLALDVPTAAYLRLVVANTALRVASLMLLGPWADLRHARFLFSRLRVSPSA